MAKWNLEFYTEAEKDIAVIDKPVRRRIIEKLEWLVNNFDGIFPTLLTGDYRNYFKFRVGDWRIFYKVDWNKNIITVCYIDHRSKAYKKTKG